MSTSNSSRFQTIEADDISSEISGWDNEDSNPYDYDQPSEDNSDNWGKLLILTKIT